MMNASDEIGGIRMKRGLILVLVLVYALAGTCFAETDVPTTAKAVREAYYEAINAEGDGDVKYQELLR